MHSRLEILVVLALAFHSIYPLWQSMEIGDFVFSPFLKLKMLGVVCDGVLGSNSKYEKKENLE